VRGEHKDSMAQHPECEIKGKIWGRGMDQEKTQRVVQRTKKCYVMEHPAELWKDGKKKKRCRQAAGGVERKYETDTWETIALKNALERKGIN